MDSQKLLIGLGVVVGIFILYYWYNSTNTRTSRKNASNNIREGFTYDQLALNAKTYTFIPTKECDGCLPGARPDFSSMTCGSGGGAHADGPLKGMTEQQIKDEIDLHYKKPREMLQTKDLLPETDISGLSFGVDPGTDFANQFVWHRTTHARLKRRNWETGAAMLRGDLIIDPGKQSWFQHDNDYRDLTPGFIPKQYCGEIDVEDLTYNMNKVY